MAVGPSKSGAAINGAVGGLLLAGGRSTRFGSEKAAALFCGRPLLEWTVDHLSTITDLIAVSAAPGSQAEAIAQSRGLTVLHDAPGDPRGPLAGIRAGLQWAKSLNLDVLAVEPCDTPLLPVDLHVRLRADIGRASVAFAETSEGAQPLCAVWRTSALEPVQQALSGGAHPPIWRLLQEIGARPVLFPNADAFINVNRPEGLRALSE